MIAFTREDGLWRIEIARPEKANALTRAMLSDILDIVRQAHGVAHVLVLTGTGRVFSSGADLDEARAGLATDEIWERLSAAVARFDGLSVAALNGTLAGGAFGMALACDLRIAVPEATFFYPSMRLGFLPQPSDALRLEALVGPSRAKLILMGAARLDAETALGIGLVDRIVPADALADEVATLAAAAVAAPRDVLTDTKALFRP